MPNPKLQVVKLVLIMVAALLLPRTHAAAAAGDPGKNVYQRYCGACHGPEGKGDGALKGFLTSKPTDLTQMAKKAAGEFPFLQVMRIIDGTEPIGPHGNTDMPVWGERFQYESTAAPADQVEVRGKLLLITDYLRTIQEK
jgi:mono/diheme cytochrome c family protein